MKIGDLIKFAYERTSTLQPTGEIHVEYGIVVEIKGEMVGYIITSCQDSEAAWGQHMLGKKVTNYKKHLELISAGR